jgi:hypothetical protein
MRCRLTRVAAGRLQPYPGGENVPDLQQAQSIEAHRRYLLSEPRACYLKRRGPPIARSIAPQVTA